jgi:hypothetical protein
MPLDTYLGIAGILLGLIGLITGYIFYRKGIKIKQPLYVMKTDNLIQNNMVEMSGLSILWNGSSITSLSSSTLVFWNNGADTIDFSDVVRSNPLQIAAIEGFKILDAKVTRSNNPSNSLSVKIAESGDKAFILFEYLDQNHGGEIQIIHTGTQSSHLLVSGDFKGARLKSINSRINKNYELFVAICGTGLWIASVTIISRKLYLLLGPVFLIFLLPLYAVLLLALSSCLLQAMSFGLRRIDSMDNPVPRSLDNPVPRSLRK